MDRYRFAPRAVRVCLLAAGTATLAVGTATLAAGCVSATRYAAGVGQAASSTARPVAKRESAPSTALPSASPAPVPAAAGPHVVMPEVLEVEQPTARRSGPNPRGQSVLVRPGDTWFGIARRHLGDGNRWHELAAANPQVRGEALPAGAVLTIP